MATELPELESESVLKLQVTKKSGRRKEIVYGEMIGARAVRTTGIGA